MEPILLSFIAGFSVILLILGFKYSGNRKKIDYTERVAPTVTQKQSLVSQNTDERSMLTKFNDLWAGLAFGAGYSEVVAFNLGKILVAICAVVGIAIFGATQIVPLAIFVGVVPMAFGWLFLTGKGVKRSVKIEKQMSTFVTSIYMYIQSGLQPVTAIMQAVDATPEPLRAELVPLVISLKNNENERVAFRKLRDRTGNGELRELCSNISIALAEGSDIGRQLMNLSEVVRVKGELRAEIQSELQDPRMTSVIGFLSFFLFFGISWFSQEDAKALWSTLMGTILLSVAAGLAALGGFIAFRIIKKAQDVA